MIKGLLSVIIPSYKDPYVVKTVESLIGNAVDDIEIIVVLDGYWPNPFLLNHPEVKIVHLGRNRGMRGAINAGVLVSEGEYIMRTDEHCMFAQGFDRELKDCKPDEIMTAVRYFLDPVKWEVMDEKPYIYEKLAIRKGDNAKFEGQRWPKRDKECKDIMIDETMAMQGSMWVMRRSWWDKVIKELDTETYGRHYQDSHEMVFKTWQAGGRLMVNKNTWFAHKHYSFDRTHNEARDAKKTWDAALDVWKGYYLKKIKPKWNL